MVLKVSSVSTNIIFIFYHIYLNEYDEAETNVVLTEETFVFSSATHENAHQVIFIIVS